MVNIHEILLKIGRTLDVNIFNEETRSNLIIQIKNLLGYQVDGLVSVKEQNLINEIYSDYNDFKLSNFADFNRFKFSTFNNINNFLKGNSFNELIHTIYAKLKKSDAVDIREELRESFKELVFLASDENEDVYIDIELSTMLIWIYGRFIYLKIDKEVDFINNSIDLIEQYFVRRSKGILTSLVCPQRQGIDMSSQEPRYE